MKSIALAVALAAASLVPVFHVAPAAAQQAAAKPYDIADFVRRDRFVDMKISPKGTYAAATVPLDDNKTVLVIIKPGQETPYGHVNFRESNTHVADFWWVNDERILFTVGEKAGGLEQPGSVGEIWGTNADGTRQGVIAGARASTEVGRARSGNLAALQMVDTLQDDDDFVLVSSVGFGTGEAPFTQVERMNVMTGARKPIGRAPARAATFLTDQKGRVRFAYGEGRQLRKTALYYRADDKADWKLINDESDSGKDISPMDFNLDNSIAYLSSSEPDGPNSVLAYDIATGTMKQVARDDNVDPVGLTYAIGKQHPIGVTFLDGKPRFEYFDPNSEDAKLHRAMQKSFGGDVVVATSATRDGRFVLLRTYSDRNPGDYFLFQADGRVADRLMSRSDWLERDRLAETRPIRYTARDGLPIEGFLTLPPGSDGKNLPLIVNPHGGPFGPYDSWGFETERQLLAAHGYAVLQVNFRGSGNYGVSFVEKGHRQWGGTMQDDLTDATQWAIREGIADKNRICIYGASYGGYASLMGVAKEPDLYKCAVGYVGVYDMQMMFGRGDVPGTVRGKDFLMEVLGRTDLDPISPNKLAANIKVPVFLAAGGADIRAPQAHSEAMERALKAAGKSVESLYYPTEGHGFVKPEHRAEFYKRLLTFFNRHIGGRAPVVATETAAK